MPNPTEAQYNSKCDECKRIIYIGENLYFHEEQKFCDECAGGYNIVCDCGSYKKPIYKKCYPCKNK
jgi:hypothetical protein